MQPIRSRITEILKENRTATVAELAEMLGMAQVSVRHHLDILVGEDLVTSAGLRRREGAGRPSQVYALTAQAHKLFPQRHDVLAGNMLVEMKSLLSAEQVRGVFVRLAEKTAFELPRYRPEQPLEERLDEVASFLTQKGYSARWEACNGCYELRTGNCPYTGVADHHPELCMMDQMMIQRLIPEAVRRESRAIDGASHCTYVITPRSAAQPTTETPKASRS